MLFQDMWIFPANPRCFCVVLGHLLLRSDPQTANVPGWIAKKHGRCAFRWVLGICTWRSTKLAVVVKGSMKPGVGKIWEGALWRVDFNVSWPRKRTQMIRCCRGSWWGHRATCSHLEHHLAMINHDQPRSMHGNSQLFPPELPGFNGIFDELSFLQPPATALGIPWPRIQWIQPASKVGMVHHGLYPHHVGYVCCLEFQSTGREWNPQISVGLVILDEWLGSSILFNVIDNIVIPIITSQWYWIIVITVIRSVQCSRITIPLEFFDAKELAEVQSVVPRQRWNWSPFVHVRFLILCVPLFWKFWYYHLITYAACRMSAKKRPQDIPKQATDQKVESYYKGIWF